MEAKSRNGHRVEWGVRLALRLMAILAVIAFLVAFAWNVYNPFSRKG
jgi:hypothetical protein